MNETGSNTDPRCWAGGWSSEEWSGRWQSGAPAAPSIPALPPGHRQHRGPPSPGLPPAPGTSGNGPPAVFQRVPRVPLRGGSAGGSRWRCFLMGFVSRVYLPWRASRAQIGSLRGLVRLFLFFFLFFPPQRLARLSGDLGHTPCPAAPLPKDASHTSGSKARAAAAGASASVHTPVVGTAVGTWASLPRLK